MGRNRSSKDHMKRWRRRGHNHPQLKQQRRRLLARSENDILDHQREVELCLRRGDLSMVLGYPRQQKNSFLPRLLYNLVGESGLAVAAVHGTDFSAKRTAMMVKQDPNHCHTTGLKTRLESEMPDSTRICFFTADSFLDEFLLDFNLPAYAAILVDEIHFRSWRTELILYFIRHCMRQRQAEGNPLKVVLVGWPSDVRPILDFFPDVRQEVVCIEQREVEGTERRVWIEDEPDIVFITVAAVLNSIDKNGAQDGDVAVFFADEADCYRAATMCSARLVKQSRQAEFSVVVANEETELQPDYILRQPGRRIIFSTDILLHSIVPDVRVVVDSGLVRTRQNLNVDESVVQVNRWQTVCKTEAVLRLRRSCRDPQPVFYRVWPLEANASPFPEPRIYTEEWADLLLWWHWAWLEPEPRLVSQIAPGDDILLPTKQALCMIGAMKTSDWTRVDPDNLTVIGYQMAGLPLDWRLSRSLIAAADLGCLAEVLTVLAMLLSGPVFVPGRTSPRRMVEGIQHFRTPLGDAVALLRVYREYRQALGGNERRWCFKHGVNRAALGKAIATRRRLRDACLEQELPIKTCGEKLEAVNMALLAGHVTHLVRHKRTMANGMFIHRYSHLLSFEEVELPSSSALYMTPPPEIVFHLGLDQLPGQVPIMRAVCPIDLATVQRSFPNLPILERE